MRVLNWLTKPPSLPPKTLRKWWHFRPLFASHSFFLSLPIPQGEKFLELLFSGSFLLSGLFLFSLPHFDNYNYCAMLVNDSKVYLSGALSWLLHISAWMSPDILMKLVPNWIITLLSKPALLPSYWFVLLTLWWNYISVYILLVSSFSSYLCLHFVL